MFQTTNQDGFTTLRWSQLFRDDHRRFLVGGFTTSAPWVTRNLPVASESRKSNPLSQHHFWSSSMIPDALGARTGAFLEPFFPWATIRDLRILNRYRKVLKRFKLSGFLEGIYFSKGVTIVLIVIIELYLLCTFKAHGTATVENGIPPCRLAWP